VLSLRVLANTAGPLDTVLAEDRSFSTLNTLV